MGSSGVKTLRYAGNGTGFTFGQAYTPGGVWPKITVHSMTRTIDYDSGSMRDEIVLSRAEPLGGGGYPMSGEQRNDQFINGEIAWNQAGTTATPGPRFVTDRIHQLWITPHGALKAAQRNRATARRNADGATTVSFSQPGRFSATLLVGADGLITQVDSVFADPVLGDTKAVTTYSDYRDFGGVKVPPCECADDGRLPGARPRLFTPVEVNPAASSTCPRRRATRPSVSSSNGSAPASGSRRRLYQQRRHRDGRPPRPRRGALNDARMAAVIEQAEDAGAGARSVSVVNSHGHFDHRRRPRGGRRGRGDGGHRRRQRLTSSAPSRPRTRCGPTGWRRPARPRSSSPSATSWRWPTPGARSSSTPSPARRTRRAS
jgi:hypothetical protein